MEEGHYVNYRATSNNVLPSLNKVILLLLLCKLSLFFKVQNEVNEVKDQLVKMEERAKRQVNTCTNVVKVIEKVLSIESPK
jgi:hypothetical protein